MKRVVAFFLIISLLALCGCELGSDNKTNSGHSSNSNNSLGDALLAVKQYSVEEQEIFSKDGVSVRVIAGQYSGIPEFQVKNETQQDVLMVLDAVVYNDVFQSKNSAGAGTIYQVPAGTDERLSKCKKTNSFEFTVSNGQVNVGTGIVSGVLVQIGTAAVQKREFRFAVYRTADDSEIPSEEDLLYRTDLVLLKTSDYDGKPVTKDLPNGECLLEEGGVRVWWQNTTYTVDYKDLINANGGVFGTFEGTIESSKDAVTYYSFSSLNGGVCVDNATSQDIRVEFTATYQEKGNNKDKEDNKEKEEILSTVELFMSVPAGKASQQLLDKNGMSVSISNVKMVDIRVYNVATGELIAQQDGLEIKSVPLIKDESGNGSISADQSVTVTPENNGK